MAKILLIDERHVVGAHVSALKDASHLVILLDPTMGNRMGETRTQLRRGCDVVILDPMLYAEEELGELNRLLEGRTIIIWGVHDGQGVTHTIRYEKPMLPSSLVFAVNRLLRV